VRVPGLAGVPGSRKVLIGGIVVAGMVVVALAAPLIAPYDPIKQNLPSALQGPSMSHLFGTDQFGRDVLSRVIWSARIDLRIAFLGATACCVVGTTLGLLAGYVGRGTDQVVSRLIDATVAFPQLVAIIALISIMGSSFLTIYIALAATGWTVYARLTRGEVLAVKKRPYILAARALGFTHRRIVFKHVLRNVITPAGLFVITDMIWTVLLFTSLSYLGLGPQPPTPEWGAMISEAQPFLLQAWWIPLFPGLAILVTGIGLAILGDGLSDALRPEAR
jgi:peptide/nickel transport system permease protein